MSPDDNCCEGPCYRHCVTVYADLLANAAGHTGCAVVTETNSCHVGTVLAECILGGD